VRAEKIIFCEGAAVSINPYFRNLKFKYSKGEILELKISGLSLNEIISNEMKSNFSRTYKHSNNISG